MSLAEKLFGSFSDRELKKINPLTKQVLALEPKYQAMSDPELQAQTPALKEKLAAGSTLDEILPDAFAVCREAAWRVLGMKHFPVQVTGGIALHRGDIAEMQTGEGKTLVATLPAYLNALTGEGVHIVTVNDYLAKRDSEWMGKLYRWLGLTVGLIVQGLDGDARRRAYNADITYGTNNEFGFDYLRDNMAIYATEMVQRGHAFAGQGVEVGGQSCHQRFAFTGLHLGNVAAVQGDAADDLHGEVLHPQHTPGRFAADGKGIGQDIIGGLAVGQLLLEHSGLCLQVGIRHGGIFFFQSQHLLGNGVDLFQLPVREAAKEFFNKGHW